MDILVLQIFMANNKKKQRYRNEHVKKRPPTSGQSDLDSSFETLLMFARRDWWSFIPIFVVFFWSSPKVFYLVQYLCINAVYGSAAWQSGLRVIDNKGTLSNGGHLSGLHNLIVYNGTFLILVSIFFGTALVVGYVNMRLKGYTLRSARRRSPKSGYGIDSGQNGTNSYK